MAIEENRGFRIFAGLAMLGALTSGLAAAISVLFVSFVCLWQKDLQPWATYGWFTVSMVAILMACIKIIVVCYFIIQFDDYAERQKDA